MIKDKNCCYFLQTEDNGPIKIGFSTNFKTTGEYSPKKVVILKIIYGGNRFIEKMLHSKFKASKVKKTGEWYKNTKELRDLIELLPRNSTPIELQRIIEKYKVTSITETKDSYFFIKERMKEINSILDRGIVNSKNSGFTQGIKFAQKVLEEVLIVK